MAQHAGQGSFNNLYLSWDADKVKEFAKLCETTCNLLKEST
jgi:hypothetical protein